MLLLPIVIPVTILLLAFLLREIDAMPDFFVVISAILYMSLVSGGIQYCIFAIFMAFKINTYQKEKKIIHLTYLAPIIYAPFFLTGLIIFTLYEGASSLKILEIFELMPFFTICIFVIGYLYVFIVNIIYRVKFNVKNNIKEP